MITFFKILNLVLDYLQDRAKGSTLYGFRGGPAGIMKCKYVELTPEYIYPYRNQVRPFDCTKEIMASIGRYDMPIIHFNCVISRHLRNI